MTNRDEHENNLPEPRANVSGNQRAVVVYTAHDEIDADLVKQFLKGCGIECVVQGRLVSGLYPGFLGDLGKRDVLVLEDDVEDAQELLAGWNSGPDSDGSTE